MHQADLNHLVGHFPQTFNDEFPAVKVTGVVLDSRKVEPGNLFVALEGGSTDGHQYIPDAVSRGAVAVVGTKRLPPVGVPYLEVADSRLALAQLSAAFYDFPGRDLVVIGVTGTDGKTTTANLIFHILRAAGIQAGMISTVNARIGDKVVDTGFHVTTPEAPHVQAYLAEMVAAGITHVVLEATSHGLAQQRLAACEFDIAAVTNITHEHLDYHGSYADYLAAKGSLITELSKSIHKTNLDLKLAVLNKDDSSFEYLAALAGDSSSEISSVAYALHADAEVRAAGVKIFPNGLRFSVEVGERPPFMIQSNLVGAYNVSNILAAVSTTAVGLGIGDRVIQEGVSGMSGIPGRMEVIDLGQDFLAIVDFAHTPNALENALRTARELTQGKVIAVFGSAGLRDQAKRRMMAEISGSLSDLTILTAEDPRTESLDEILDEMAAGVASRGGIEERTFWRVRDRGNAIRFALALAEEGDLVIACGKGHEQSMCFGEIEYAWDDCTAMRAALAELLQVDGPLMPYLPTQED
jgi:UDP-N-acetylmuramoyl-L-alanyl-D-glutamate--2,6-diaminopimelate ligase